MFACQLNRGASAVYVLGGLLVYVFGISWIFFALYKKLFGLRVSAETELRGLDIPEMGGLGYNPDAEFYEPPVAVAASASGGGE